MTDSDSIAITNARVLTLRSPESGNAPRRGSDLSELGVLERGWVLVQGGRIKDLGDGTPPEFAAETRIIDARGRVVMPALVDCHTHACFLGDRNDEFEARLAGAGYLEILAAGGGIMSTVRSVRSASEAELVEALLRRLEQTARLGTGTIEVKSGYGLDPDTELKMLRAIHTAAERAPQIVMPTFLGAHALDSDATDPDHAVERIIAEALPAAAAAFPATAAACSRPLPPAAAAAAAAVGGPWPRALVHLLPPRRCWAPPAPGGRGPKGPTGPPRPPGGTQRTRPRPLRAAATAGATLSAACCSFFGAFTDRNEHC